MSLSNAERQSRWRRQRKARDAEARRVIEGLMEIAEIAMPDTYFQSDSRTTTAREWLKGTK